MGVHLKKNGIDIPLSIKRTSTVLPSANNISYNNNVSELESVNVQGAIDELSLRKVEANPTLIGTEELLTSIEIDGVKYKFPSLPLAESQEV